MSANAAGDGGCGRTEDKDFGGTPKGTRVTRVLQIIYEA